MHYIYAHIHTHTYTCTSTPALHVNSYMYAYTQHYTTCTYRQYAQMHKHYYKTLIPMYADMKDKYNSVIALHSVIIT